MATRTLMTALTFASASLAGTAMAESIGWNVTAGAGYMPGFGNDVLGPAEVAGAPSYAQDNWNNHSLNGQGPGDTPISLLDDAGNATSVSITGWELSGGTLIGNAWGYGDTSTPGAKMHNTYTSGGGADVVTLTYEGLATFAPLGYDVVVYYGASVGSSATGTITVNGTAVTATASDSIGSVGYIEYVDEQTSANYIVFQGLGGDTLTVAADTNDYGVSGLQIIAVPEPGSLALLGLGTLLVARRRRN